MTGLLPALLLALGQLVAPSGAPAAASVERGTVAAAPSTRLGEELLARCPVVVVARVISVRRAGLSAQLLSLRVVERMLGPDAAPDSVLSVFAPPSELAFGHELLAFLEPQGDAGRFRLVFQVPSSDAHYEAKLALTRRQVWLLEEPDPERRIDLTFLLLFRSLASADPWVRGHALEELQSLATRHPALFTDARRQGLKAVVAGLQDEAVLAGVERVAALLRAAEARGMAAEGSRQSER